MSEDCPRGCDGPCSHEAASRLREKLKAAQEAEQGRLDAVGDLRALEEEHDRVLGKVARLEACLAQDKVVLAEARRQTWEAWRGWSLEKDRGHEWRAACYKVCADLTRLQDAAKAVVDVTGSFRVDELYDRVADLRRVLPIPAPNGDACDTGRDE